MIELFIYAGHSIKRVDALKWHSNVGKIISDMHGTHIHAYKHMYITGTTS